MEGSLKPFGNVGGLGASLGPLARHLRPVEGFLNALDGLVETLRELFSFLGQSLEPLEHSWEDSMCC